MDERRGDTQHGTRDDRVAAGPSASGTPDLAAATDGDLVRAALEGAETFQREDAFRELVERHQGRAFRVARSLVPSNEDAQDLAQEAFLRVFKSLDRFDFEHEFTTWLYRIVTNLAIDHLRKRRPTLSTTAPDDDGGEFDLVDADAPQPSAAAEADETARRVRECIAALPPHFRSVLALRELEGLPGTEIARIVGATHVTVRWRLHRARKLFQEEWERRERLGSLGPAGRALRGDDAAPENPEPRADGPEA